jgi:hypothetical protein
VRKAAATEAADNEATHAQLNSIFGWKGDKMASLYTESADRKRLAAGAIAKLSRGFRLEPSVRRTPWRSGAPLMATPQPVLDTIVGPRQDRHVAQ